MRYPSVKHSLVDEVEAKQPLGRFLLLMFRSFENDLLAEAGKRGFSDISMSDLQVLHFVCPKGSTSTEISRLAGISKQAVGKAVLSLQSRGYLKRIPSQLDRRSVLVEFTPKGVKLLKAGFDIIGGIERGYSRTLGAENFKLLKEQLGRLIDAYPLNGRTQREGDGE